MLPIRLGTVNANGPQDLFVFALTRKGRVETTNYRTVKLPTGMEIPLFVKDQFADFYKAMFTEQVKKEDMRCVFTEYAWDMGWCDPCAAEPLSNEELRKLGVFWLEGGSRNPLARPMTSDVFVTRMHVRYDRAHFTEDLVFQETRDRENFQGRYVLRHPWKGEANCDAGKKYGKVPERQERKRRRSRNSRAGRSQKSANGWGPAGSGRQIRRWEEMVGETLEMRDSRRFPFIHLASG